MALPDIKDVGILAGFVRWGWPWHGLCEGGVIGTSGKTITQPWGGNAWLIDKGLPALDMSPELIASEAAEGREWRNYGLISGGQVNGTWLPRRMSGGAPVEPNSFVHVDEDGINWLVTVLGTFPATNTVRLNLSIVRFGHFEQGVGEQSPITKTVDISCENIQPTYSASREVKLQDVWTNGSKALLCVFYLWADQSLVFSAIEMVLTGTGGATGSGLVVDATEVKGQSQLTPDEGNQTGTLGSSGGIMSGITGAPGTDNYVPYYCPPGSPDDCVTAEYNANPDGEFSVVGWHKHDRVETSQP